MEGGYLPPSWATTFSENVVAQRGVTTTPPERQDGKTKEFNCNGSLSPSGGGYYPPLWATAFSENVVAHEGVGTPLHATAFAWVDLCTGILLFRDNILRECCREKKVYARTGQSIG